MLSRKKNKLTATMNRINLYLELLKKNNYIEFKIITKLDTLICPTFATNAVIK